LDEPFSNLDIGHRNTLRSVLDDLHVQKGLTFVIVSHNPSEVLGWADRILVMKQGRCIQAGSPQEIYDAPNDEYVAQLLGPYNLIQTNETTQIKIVRPERLRLVSPDGASIKGIVVQEEFEGHTSLYTIIAGEQSWFVRDVPGTLLGKEVGIFVEINPIA
jgi:iron(III) transport system ATP-binding protein